MAQFKIQRPNAARIKNEPRQRLADMRDYQIKKTFTVAANSTGSIKLSLPADGIHFLNGIGYKFFRGTEYTVLNGFDEIYRGSSQLGSLIAPQNFSRPIPAKGYVALACVNDKPVSRTYEVIFLLNSSQNLEFLTDAGQVEPKVSEAGSEYFGWNTRRQSNTVEATLLAKTVVAGGSLEVGTIQYYAIGAQLVPETVRDGSFLPLSGNIWSVQNNTTTTSGNQTVELVLGPSYDPPAIGQSTVNFFILFRKQPSESTFNFVTFQIGDNSFDDDGSIAGDTDLSMATNTQELLNGYNFAFLDLLIKLGRDVRRAQIDVRSNDATEGACFGAIDYDFTPDLTSTTIANARAWRDLYFHIGMWARDFNTNVVGPIDMTKRRVDYFELTSGGSPVTGVNLFSTEPIIEMENMIVATRGDLGAGAPNIVMGCLVY